MKPQGTTIEPSPELCRRCGEYGFEVVKHIPDHLKRLAEDNRLEYPIHEMPYRQGDAKLAEVVMAIHSDQDPLEVVQFDPCGPLQHFDVPVDRTRVEVKHGYIGYQYLLYPLTKIAWYPTKQFDVLAFVKAWCRWHDDVLVEARGFVRGWVGKAEFLRRKRIATTEKGLKPGTWFLYETELHRIGVFPGHSDDHREHYCWCGEPGVRGNSRGEFHCGAHHK